MKKLNYKILKGKLPLFMFSLYDKLKCTSNLLNPFKKNINNPECKVSCKPFFIIGSGRCGTTLLRATLTSNSKVSIPPESYVLPIIIRKYYSYNFLPWNELIKIILGEFEASEFFYLGIKFAV